LAAAFAAAFFMGLIFSVGKVRCRIWLVGSPHRSDGR